MARILVADDDAALRALVVRALSSDGHQVEEAGDGLDALEQIQVGRFDLVVSDLDMPGLDGMGLVARVTPHTKLKVLLISALSEELQRARGFPADRVGTLEKPFTLEQLKSRVRALITG